MLIIILFLFQRWENHLLRWNKSKFGEIDRIHVEAKRVWVPDILLYNKLVVLIFPLRTQYASRACEQWKPRSFANVNNSSGA